LRIRRGAWRRLSAALTAAALLVLGAPLHVHGALDPATAASLDVAADASVAAHAGSFCPACHTSFRERALPAAGGSAPLAAATPLRLDLPGAPVAPSAATRPPTPPRGPPPPTA
jgi:hypothetical protein